MRTRIHRTHDGTSDAQGADPRAGAGPSLRRALAQRGGASLPAPVQARLEGASGADLSGVRVHTGPASAAASAELGAQAFAVGDDIHFGAGRYAPEDPFGMHLIAHEVAHTVQQRGGAGALAARLEVSQPDDAHEREAEQFASAVMRGEPAPGLTPTGATPAGRVDRFDLGPPSPAAPDGPQGGLYPEHEGIDVRPPDAPQGGLYPEHEGIDVRPPDGGPVAPAPDLAPPGGRHDEREGMCLPDTGATESAGSAGAGVGLAAGGIRGPGVASGSNAGGSASNAGGSGGSASNAGGRGGSASNAGGSGGSASNAGGVSGGLVTWGSRGAHVEHVQGRLGIAVTGAYDPATHRAIVAFQRAHGLTPDGIVGPRTRAVLG